MIGRLSDDNVVFLIDLMQRFMIPGEKEVESGQTEGTEDTADLMQEMEAMRERAKVYFTSE